MNNKVRALFREQLLDWQLAAQKYAELSQVEWKIYEFNGFDIRVQYNPARIRSSGAPVDVKAIQNRPCFLCNLPPEQKGIPYPPYYHILINPYPVFPLHLTIPDTRHVPQNISGRFEHLLNLAADLPDFTFIYNGPRSGASAPDHAHFQAGEKGFLPVENDIKSFLGKKLLRKDTQGNVFRMENYLRKCFVFESQDKNWLIEQAEQFIQILQKLFNTDEEPMLNIICWKEDDTWQLLLFPRKQHRPWQYFETGETQLLISPGVVDFGGVLVVPRKVHYDKIDAELLIDLYTQLTITDEMEKSVVSLLID
jgi:hypothetical protein